VKTRKESQFLHNCVSIIVDRITHFQGLIGAIITSSSLETIEVGRRDTHLLFGFNLAQFGNL
jgi:hypothetical protein